MEDFIAVTAQMVVGAVIQEAVSRTISFVLGKRKEKASKGQYQERLTKAVHEVEFVLQRTAKLQITEPSLLRNRFELKRDFIHAACLLNSKNKKRRQAHQEQGRGDISQAVTCSSSPRGWVTRPPAMFSVSSFIGMSEDQELCLSCDDVERFEQLADSARNILRHVQSGCSLRRYMFFPSPLVRRLFDERTTLLYITVVQGGRERFVTRPVGGWFLDSIEAVQGDQVRFFYMSPAPLEEDRGVEAMVWYIYLDRMRPENSFGTLLLLRLSESTDIVGVVMNCLKSSTSQFNFVADSATRELTLLASNLQDVISHSEAPPPWVFQDFNSMAQYFRPDPLCCKANGHGPPANNIVSSELSQVFPEEVIYFGFECYVSTPEYSLRRSADAAGKRIVMRNRRPPLKLTFILAPHGTHFHDGSLQECYAVEQIGENGEEFVDVGIQQLSEAARSRAINCLLRQPKARVTEYGIGWFTKHGAAWFLVEKLRAQLPSKPAARPSPEEVSR